LQEFLHTNIRYDWLIISKLCQDSEERPHIRWSLQTAILPIM
jgi:hypothetical protein